MGGFGLLQGVDYTEPNFVTLFFVVGIPLLLALSTTRDELSAGPGWFSAKGVALWGPHRWVRTDRLVVLKSSASGVAVHLHMQDDEGRRASVLASALTDAPLVAAQVEVDVRHALDREGAQLETDHRARTILLGDPVPPLRERLKRRKRR